MSDTKSSAQTSRRAVVENDQAGWRLDRFLVAALGDISRSRLQQLIENGAVTHTRKTIRDGNFRVKPGDVYVVSIPPPTPAIPQGQDIPLQVVYEDKDLIVIEKPAGLVVHPAAGNPDGTLVNALIAHCGASLSGIGGERRPGIVHRIDKETSGLLVAAKNDAAHQALSAAFAAHAIARAYLCLVWGVPSPAAGSITGNIGRDPKDRKRMAVVSRGG